MVTRSVLEQFAEEKIDLELDAIGKVNLKGFSDPIPLYAVSE